MQSPYTTQFVAITLHQHNPISLHKSLCGQHTNSAQRNLPTQFSLWPQHCPSSTQSPYTFEFLAKTLPQNVTISLHIQFVAATLPQQNPISLHINSVCGHHTASAQPNIHTQFSLWPTHCLITSQSPYTIQFVASTLPQHISFSLHINSVFATTLHKHIPIYLHNNSVFGHHTASAHRNFRKH
jgi:hypothetical protein